MLIEHLNLRLYEQHFRAEVGHMKETRISFREKSAPFEFEN